MTIRSRSDRRTVLRMPAVRPAAGQWSSGKCQESSRLRASAWPASGAEGQALGVSRQLGLIVLEMENPAPPEKGLGILALHGVDEGVAAHRADALGQRSAATLGLDFPQRGALSGRAEKPSGEDFEPGMPGVVTPFGHRPRQSKKGGRPSPARLQTVVGSTAWRLLLVAEKTA